MAIERNHADLKPGVEVPVSSEAVELVGASLDRRMLILQNVGSNAVRVGAAGVTGNTGFRLAAGDGFVFEGPACPDGPVYAIRESADSTVLAQEVA